VRHWSNVNTRCLTKWQYRIEILTNKTSGQGDYGRIELGLLTSYILNRIRERIHQPVGL
jgi:hypothetical protein